MVRWIQIVVLVWWCIGCAQKGSVRVRQPKNVTRPPHIAGIVDLGGLPVISSSGALDKSRSDGRFTPGEFVLISGENLDDKRALIRFGDQLSDVVSFVDDGLLVRVPRRITYLRDVVVSVETPMGRATRNIAPQGYLILSDTSNGEIRFFRTEKSAEGRHLLEPECDAVALPGARFHILSRSGAFLYGIPQSASEQGTHAPSKAITVIHLGAKDHPQEIASIPYSSNGEPMAVAPDTARNRFLLLTTKELFVYSIEDERRPALKATISLEGTDAQRRRYGRIALLKNAEYAVVQDELNNRLVLIHISSRMPLRIVNELVVTRSATPRLIDVMTDSKRDDIVHVLEGPNLYLADGLNEIFHRTDESKMSSRLISYRLRDEGLYPISEISLEPGAIPLFTGYATNGSKLISLVGTDVMRLGNEEEAKAGLKGATEILLNAMQLGKVIRIDQEGNVSSWTEESALFLTLTSPPDNRGMTAVMMRIGVRKFPPSVGVELSLVIMDDEGRHRDAHTLRNLSWQMLCPPYHVPLVTFQ